MDDVLRCALGVDAAPRQRRRGDERERKRRRAGEHAGEQVRVGEARDVAHSRPRGEAKGHQVQPLDRKRHGRAVEQAPQAVAQPEGHTAMAAEATPAQDEHDRGEADGDRAVQGESPGERHQAVRVRGEHEEHEAADAAEGKGRSGR